MAKVIKADDALPEVSLPAAGHERDEELRRRTDTLQAEAEIRAEQTERVAIDPSKFQVENELAYYFDELEVKGGDPAYAYCWVQSGQHGGHVQRKLYLGWEVVQGNDTAAEALKSTDTTRRLGDVLLMRIHKDRKRLLDMREEYRRRQQEDAVAGTLEELQYKYSYLGVKAGITDPDDPRLRRAANRAQARQLGQRQLDSWMREGRVPGMAMPN